MLSDAFFNHRCPFTGSIQNVCCPLPSQGPESFAYRDGYLYSGIIGGEIVRIKLDEAADEDAAWEVIFRDEDGVPGLEFWRPNKYVPPNKLFLSF